MDLHTTCRNAFRLNLALVSAVLVLATGCGSSVATRPTPTVKPTATLRPAPTPVAGLLAPPPADCAVVPPPQTFTTPPDFGGGFIGSLTHPIVFYGSSPAWEQGLGSPLHLEQISGPVPYPLTKVMWVLGPNYSGQVTLQGQDIRTAAPLWLQLAGNGNDNPELATLSIVLDAAAPNRGTTTNSLGHWSIFGVITYFTSAGCYSLDVTWPKGHWRTVFAAGR